MGLLNENACVATPMTAKAKQNRKSRVKVTPSLTLTHVLGNTSVTNTNVTNFVIIITVGGNLSRPPTNVLACTVALFCGCYGLCSFYYSTNTNVTLARFCGGVESRKA